MFTGIIKEVGTVRSVRKSRGMFLVAVAKPARWKVRVGESVSLNGICSTVADMELGVMFFEYMPETQRRTTVRFWKRGDALNLEKSLRVGEPLDGHLVTGHVDGVGRVGALVREGGARLLKLEAPPELLALIAKKGSVAVDGVSLTAADVADGWFSVALIPYTLSRTALRNRRVGDRVNIETDIFAKYAQTRKTYICAGRHSRRATSVRRRDL
ncbi:MAG: riboflavin synthase [Patescibacteria group bacterium]